MIQRQIGAVIKEIANEKNLKVGKLAEKSGKNRQAIYMTFGRSEMSNEEIADWSKVLGVTEEELFSRWRTGNILGETKIDSNGDNYLQQHLKNLEEQFRLLNEQLAVKDKQIDGLQRTVDVLLKKSEDELQTTSRDVISLNSQLVA